MNRQRRPTLEVRIGKVTLGGSHPVAVQTMLKNSLANFKKAAEEAQAVEKEGAELIRVAVPTLRDVPFVKDLKKEVSVPLVADIHFNGAIALKVIEAGADKIRLNPGNTKSGPVIRQIAREAKQAGVAIRIGVNAGSLPAEFYIEYADDIPKAMVETMKTYLPDFEEEGFDQIVISMKSSRVTETIEAYRRLAPLVNYPFHIGVTEAGSGTEAVIKSAVGIGVLLEEGIGDTIRISLAGPGVDEVRAGFEILKALGLREKGFDLIACPTCGRVKVDVELLAERVKNVLRTLRPPETLFRVAVMGCEVNGPGESRMADLGIAGGLDSSTLYFKGRRIGRIKNSALDEEIEKLLTGVLQEDEDVGRHTRV